MSQFSMALMKRFSEYVSLEGMYPIISTTFRARPCGTQKKMSRIIVETWGGRKYIDKDGGLEGSMSQPGVPCKKLD